MKLHTTNYTNTFIEIADDCPANSGEIPPLKSDSKTVANLQFDIVKNNPYKFTSDDVIFEIYAQRNQITKTNYKNEKEKFFSKGQPCLRASPLTKRYGWGIHNNHESKIAIYGCESKEYEKYKKDKKLKFVKAMKSSK